MTTTSRDGRTLTLCYRVRQQPCSSLDAADVVARSQFVVCNACVGKVNYRVVYTDSKARTSSSVPVIRQSVSQSESAPPGRRQSALIGRPTQTRHNVSGVKQYWLSKYTPNYWTNSYNDIINASFFLTSSFNYSNYRVGLFSRGVHLVLLLHPYCDYLIPL